MFSSFIGLQEKKDLLPKRGELAQLGFSVVCHHVHTVITHAHDGLSNHHSDSAAIDRAKDKTQAIK